MPVARVGAQRGPQLGHHGRRADPVPDHVAGDERDAAAAEREGVVPVAAEPGAAGRQVAARQLEPGDPAQVGQEAALEDVREPALLVELGVLDGDRRATRRQLQQVPLVGA